MGATNRTQNYNLPQFVGSDKPTWLGDFNGAMSSIDTQMKANNDLGSQANTKADTALTNAETAQTTATTADGKADSATATATTALSKSLANETAINDIKAKFSNFNVTDVRYNSMTTSNGIINDGDIKIAVNNDNSLAKMYGTLYFTPATIGTVNITIPNVFPNGLDSEITINDAGMQNNFNTVNLILSTNGNVIISTYASATNQQRIRLLPFLYLLEDFGDTPQN